MNGERAVQVLGALLHGERGDTTDDELAVLLGFGLVTSVDTARLGRARSYHELMANRRIGTPEDAARVLADVESRLKSTFHRMISFEATLRREEQERARLRGLLGAMKDPAEWARIEVVRTALATVAPEAPWVALDGGTVSAAVTALGWRAAFALQVRLERYREADFRAFAKRFLKSEAGMEQLGADYRHLHEKLGGTVPKGLENVVTGLLKSGLPPEQALSRFRQARRDVSRGRLAVEVPHAAAAVVRAGAKAPEPDIAWQRLDRASLALCDTGLSNGPVLRGAAKVLVDAPDLAVAVRRFRGLYDGLPRRLPADTRLRAAARLFPAAGNTAEVLERLNAALTSNPTDALVAAALAAQAQDGPGLAAVVERHAAIVRELVARRAFPAGSVPASTADLVSVPGGPEEVVELLRQLVAHLPAREDKEAWGLSTDWPTAVAFARRFAY